MKLSERINIDDTSAHILQTHDVTASLKLAEKMRHAREAGHTGSIPKDWVPVGVVPAVMARVWAQEAGVRMDDADAMNELLNKKLMDGDFGKFRVVDGNI